jgi:hypothetical protein
LGKNFKNLEQEISNKNGLSSKNRHPELVSGSIPNLIQETDLSVCHCELRVAIQHYGHMDCHAQLGVTN